MLEMNLPPLASLSTIGIHMCDCSFQPCLKSLTDTETAMSELCGTVMSRHTGVFLLTVLLPN